MGGYGSTRWGMTVTRLTADGLPRLDVRTLARAGALRPGTTATVAWGSGAAVTTEVRPDAPGVVLLRYQACTGRVLESTVDEPVPLTRTPCTFGGSRPWFRCPSCGRRCAVLYGLAGRFRCRGCHRLAYASTRRKP